MSFETDFDTAFTILLGKAQGTITDVGPIVLPPPGSGGGGGSAAATSYIIPFWWGGGGTLLTASGADPQLVEVPDPGEIVWVHLYAGNSTGEPVAVTAVLDLQMTQWASFGGSSPVYGDGTSPRITADSLADMSLSGWYVHFDSGDTLIARITSFIGASATWLAMMIKVRRDNTAQVQAFVTDGSGAQVLDAYGNPIIFRG